jgi:hypothetical protein
MANEALEPGTYYQDILTDGTVGPLRQNFPTLQRTSFDTRPPVAETRMIVVETIYSRPKPPEVHLRPSTYLPPAPPVEVAEAMDQIRSEAEALFRTPKL